MMYRTLLLLGCVMYANAYFNEYDYGEVPETPGPTEFQDDSQAQSGATEAKMVSVAALSQLAFAKFSGRITFEEERDAWLKTDKCIDKLKDNLNMMDRFVDWEFLTEFIELQITKSMKFSRGKGKQVADVAGSDKLDVFIRLTPVKYWDVLQETRFPIPRYNRVNREAVAEIFVQVCEYGKKDLSEEVKDKINRETVRKVFNALLIESYTKDQKYAIEDIVFDASSDKPNGKKWKLIEKRWKQIAKQILMSGSALMQTCLDDKLNNGGMRDVDVRLREIATELGIDNCEPPFVTANPMYCTAFPPVKLAFMVSSCPPPVMKRNPVFPPSSPLGPDNDEADGPPGSPGGMMRSSAPHR